MPVQNDIAILEQPRLDHEDFGAPAFFGRATVKPHGAFDLAGFDLIDDRQRRRRGRHAEQMMSAPMPVSQFRIGFPVRHGVL